MSDHLLEISGLSGHYPGRAGWFFQKAAPKKAKKVEAEAAPAEEAPAVEAKNEE